MKTIARLLFLVTAVSVIWTSDITAATIPTPGRITMVDLGATSCIPCKMMAPILKELEVEYKDKAVVTFVDVGLNATEGKRFGVRAIPTQIFFDKEGKEVFRHVGFMEKQAIIDQLERMLKEQ
ncbi:MAG: thioredoxin fold domain-containing protein [Desulfobulbaceae bacterium]|jgi:thioredoxin 1|nr:thioredoxin fold domain-containing protein [Desulfobulbaceae bacterium]